MQRHFDESIAGTAIDHLGKGLFEAHGRDEAGWEEEAGHKDMWFAASDIAFEGRTADIDIDAMLERTGCGTHAYGPGAAVPRILQSDIDANLELIANRRERVLTTPLQGFQHFAQGEDWPS